MKKDIDFLPVKDVLLTVARRDGVNWEVFLLNRSGERIETVLVTSKGYGEVDGEKQKTSLLRHAIPHVEAGEFALIEPIDPTIFHLTNEYWVSYFIGNQIFDKKFIFVPDSIIEKNLTFISELSAEGVLHS
jgi:hypothetical protein